jgi:hypothetical protein
MQTHNRRSIIVFLCAFAFLATQLNLSARSEDVVHILSGVVKHVDRNSKTLVVKADDGVEHSIKWTGKTTWEGTEVSGKSIRSGSELTIRYAEKGGENTAVGVKKIGKETGKALK